MSRLLENKLMFAAIFVLFVLACASHAIPRYGNVMIADGPIIPPDPWDGNVTIADGPIIPPDPWDGNVMLADGPIIPPDPWDGNLSVTA
jgi:hypothetical protein